MIAIEGINAKSNMINADEICNVFKVLHHSVDIMRIARSGHGGVGSGFHAGNAALFRAGLDHVIAKQAAGIPKSAGADVRKHDGLFRHADGICRGLLPAVRAINEHTDFVHALYGFFAKFGQAAVAILFEAIAQGVGLE